MSASMARQGGRVHLEPSDMHLALNMAKIVNGGFWRAAIEETHYLIKNARTKVHEEKKRGVEFSGHAKVKVAIERHPAMLRQNQTDGWLPCTNRIAKNPHTCWRRKGTGAPPPEQHRQMTPEPMPPLPKMPPQPGTPPAPRGSNAWAPNSQIVNVPSRYTYLHKALPCAELFTHDASAQDSQNHTDYDPDMLTDKGTATGWHTICCVVTQLTVILKTTAAYWANLAVMTSIDRKERDFEVYYHLQLADTVKYIIKDIFICIIKVKWSDQEESQWKC